MPSITLDSISKAFHTVEPLSNVSLEIKEGEFMVLLGPSGCGKTTLLRCIAGLESPDSGRIEIGRRTVFSRTDGIELSPRERQIGMVFQNYALYPHMSVYENVAFGLRMRKAGKNEIKRRVEQALRLVDLVGFEKRSPKQLSGGQRQRVAVARTLATEPRELLFDEPLSNLDPKLRVSLRAELRALHKKIHATSLYVTHDQTEAMILGDRIAVLQDGVITQVDTPRNVYDHPATVQVAEFTGNPKTNIVAGEIHRSENSPILIPESDPYCFLPLPKETADFAGIRVYVHFRPEDVDVALDPAEDVGRLPVITVMPDGSHYYAHLRLGDSAEQILAKASASHAFPLRRGSHVGLRVQRGNIFDHTTGHLLLSFGYNSAREPAFHE
ncbi:MAG: ABC transporter ATP-binding protein [Spirochaetales bacterium]